MKTLRLIGYWHSDYAPSWPDPGRFVDRSWSPSVRDAVVRYLRSCEELRYGFGTSWCRFHCPGHGKGGVGSAERSDGRFVWPDGLVHYVERHAVRLPDDFVASLSLPAEPVPQGPDEYRIDDGWWRGQSGFGSAEPTFLASAALGQLFALTDGVTPDAPLLKEVRTCNAVSGRSLPEIRAAFERGERLLLLAKVYEVDVKDLRDRLQALGLPTEFEPAEPR
jgi:hypothetical protein